MSQFQTLRYISLDAEQVMAIIWQRCPFDRKERVFEKHPKPLCPRLPLSCQKCAHILLIRPSTSVDATIVVVVDVVRASSVCVPLHKRSIILFSAPKASHVIVCGAVTSHYLHVSAARASDFFRTFHFLFANVFFSIFHIQRKIVRMQKFMNPSSWQRV
jgi:hypothetical protein